MHIGAGGAAPVGGFIPRDLTGSNQYADGPNLYQYVRSNPVNKVDPQGTISMACYNHRLKKAKVDPKVQQAITAARSKKCCLGIPRLGKVKCKKSCIGGVSGRYNPFSRNISMCAKGLPNGISQARFTQIVYHELIHAKSICGWWKLGCKNCMIEEKRAYFKAGQSKRIRVIHVGPGAAVSPVGDDRIFSTIGKTIWGWVGLPNRNNEHPLNL